MGVRVDEGSNPDPQIFSSIGIVGMCMRQKLRYALKLKKIWNSNTHCISSCEHNVQI